MQASRARSLESLPPSHVPLLHIAAVTRAPRAPVVCVRSVRVVGVCTQRVLMRRLAGWLEQPGTLSEAAVHMGTLSQLLVGHRGASGPV
eukprot:10847745-Alexandrium_andersonii.AAC.1